MDKNSLNSQNKIKQSVINTFERVGIDWKNMDNIQKNKYTANRFGGGSCMTTQLISNCIAWIYQTSNDYEDGNYKVNISDFDRIRYFVLEQDKEAYMTCID